MRLSLVAASCLLVLCACNTAPPLLTPDGSQRTPANHPEAIERYRALLPSRAAAPDHADTLQRIAALERDVAQLRQQLAALASAPSVTMPESSEIDGVSVALTRTGVLFRMPQPTGAARCKPGPALHGVLFNTARLSRRITVSGYTDTESGDNINRALAHRRARCAPQQLIAAGIPPQRISSRAFPAGAFISENHSAAGRARNRRIEIARQDLDAATLAALAGITTGSAP